MSLRLSKDTRKRSKAEDKEKKEKKPQRIVELNGKYVIWVSLFTVDWS